MNVSNDGMAPDKTGTRSLDIMCCTLCGNCFTSKSIEYLASITKRDLESSKTYTQNKLHFLHNVPKFFAYLVVGEIAVLRRSEEEINRLSKALLEIVAIGHG
jgi:hypothetical protein